MLTHFGIVMPYGVRERGQHLFGTGLLRDGTKPLPEPIWLTIEILWHSFQGNAYMNTQDIVKFIHLKSHPQVPWGTMNNYLTHLPLVLYICISERVQHWFR